MPLPPFRRLFRIDRTRPDLRGDIDYEIEYHLARHAERLVAEGMPPSVARQEALRAFGDVGAVTREVERIDRARLARRRHREILRGMLTDIRVAFRSLRRAPGFTITALLTLALGLGVTTAMFSVVNAVLLRTLPYPEPARLVQIQEVNASGVRANWPAANFNEMRERTRTLERAAYYSGGVTTVRGTDEPRRAQVFWVSGDFFTVLGVAPAQGSTFGPADDQAGSPPAAVVSHRFWQSALGGDAEFERRTLRIGGEAYPVIGVMPPSFAFPADAEVWVATHDDTPSRTAHNWAGIARLAPGATSASARAELDAIMRDIKHREGAGSDAVGAYVEELHRELSAGSRRQVLLLQGAVGLVLLLTCVNLTSANLARAEHRHREVAVRAALGAARSRIVRLLLTESLLLAIVGGALGFALAAALIHLASASASTGLPGFARLSLDLRVLGFAAAVTIASGVGIGLLPALGASRVDLRRVIGDGGRATAGRLRARSVLVAVEFALAFAVLIPAGLLLRSMNALVDTDPGFRPERVIAATISLPPDTYPDTTAIALVHERVLSRLAAIPGVESVALASSTPMGARDLSSDFEVEGREPAGRRAGYRVVSPGYLNTMGIPLVRGRNIEATDVPGVPHVMLINEAAARLYWPDGDALGQRIRFPGMDDHVDDWMTIVGVVGDVRFDGLDAAPRPEMFVSHLQRPERADVATLLVRGTGDVGVLSTAIRGVIRAEAPTVPVDLRTMEGVVDQTLGARRFVTTIVSAFGALSLMLAAVGVYGVLAYSVAQRRRELAVRLALGAQPGELRRMVLRDGLGAALPGLLGGAIAALAFTRLIRALVVGVSPADPATYVAVASLLLGAALLASFVPARRATRVDPIMALRAD